MDEATPARILIADDHALVREGLRTMLSGEVVAEANDGRQALDTCRELKPDLVLMDVRMPVMDGLQATRKIKQEMPKTSVMMVTMHENPDYLFEAVKAGAAGYVLKDASGERLLSAVRRTLEGESPLNQELAMQLLVRLARESSYSSEEEIGGGSGERSGRPSPGASGTTPVRGSEEDGEPLASHPVATDPTQGPVCCKGGCDTSYPFAFDLNHRVTESERAFDLPIPKIGNAGWMRSRRTLQSCCY